MRFGGGKNIYIYISESHKTSDSTYNRILLFFYNANCGSSTTVRLIQIKNQGTVIHRIQSYILQLAVKCIVCFPSRYVHTTEKQKHKSIYFLKISKKTKKNIPM